MPIVFVHGVNSRKGSGYDEYVRGRTGFLREIVAPALGLSSAAVSVRNPYWGDKGVTFSWGMASLPSTDDTVESFGSNAAETDDVAIASTLAPSTTIVESARRDLERTLEAVYALMLRTSTSDDEASAIASSFVSAMSYAASNPTPTWLADDGVEDSNFAGLLAAVIAKQNTDESFGAGEFFSRFNEAVRRLANALPDAASGALVGLARRGLNHSASLFIGDAFSYLSTRGTYDDPGPIVRVVQEELRAASLDAAGEKLVVIGHSFGGPIVYDILSHFAPTQTVDLLVTVGAQVGLFEEMKLFRSSDRGIPNGAELRVPVPPNIKGWLNVYDHNDVLAYRAEPIFDRATDFHYDTGYSALGAHGGYFMQPSFYRRLATRLTQLS